MAYKCAVCGKAPVSGGSYSHSNMRTKRSFKPNLQKQKVMQKRPCSQTHQIVILFAHSISPCFLLVRAFFVK